MSRKPDVRLPMLPSQTNCDPAASPCEQEGEPGIKSLSLSLESLAVALRARTKSGPQPQQEAALVHRERSPPTYCALGASLRRAHQCLSMVVPAPYRNAPTPAPQRQQVSLSLRCTLIFARNAVLRLRALQSRY